MVEVADYTIKRRGITIGSLYHALGRTLEALHDPDAQMHFVDIDGVAIEAAHALEDDDDRAAALLAQVEDINMRVMAAPPAGEAHPISSNCDICFGDYNATDKLPVTPLCGHVVCLSCMTQTLQHGRIRCPKCNTDIRAITRLFI